VRSVRDSVPTSISIVILAGRNHANVKSFPNHASLAISGNPREMFTDSAFYSPKFHPSVADQVEMAHKLTMSLYDEGNQKSKGQGRKMTKEKSLGVLV
jgi:hypothetical protein